METSSNTWSIKSQVWVVISACVVSFLVHRYLVRGWVLEQSESALLIIIVNSFPNFLEGIIGTISLSGIVLWFRNRGSQPTPKKESAALFNWVTVIAAIYVLSQELNWYNISLENTFDLYDIIASVLGLLLVNRFLNTVGFLNYKIDAG